MAKLRSHTIIAGPSSKISPQITEALAQEEIQPGALVVFEGGKLKKHATADKATPALLAQHNYIGGGDIRKPIASGDTVMAIMCEPDVDYYALVKASEKIAVGDKLTSNGDGTLKKVSAAEEAIFYAREAHTVASDGAELVKVRKI
ncbi:hypothetical protein ACQP43_02470 [Actinobacillus pleuropneumoniae]|uniref:hypothetical protein n=1 Tax=Actinobacillus pleuropneumoniae TaxID=715 RepID=UPI003D06D17E